MSKRYGIPTPFVVIIISTISLGLWQVLPVSLRNRIVPVAQAASFVVNTEAPEDPWQAVEDPV